MLKISAQTGRCDQFSTFVENDIEEAVGVICAIFDDFAGRGPCAQRASGSHVVMLAGTEFETNP